MVMIFLVSVPMKVVIVVPMIIHMMVIGTGMRIVRVPFLIIALIMLTLFLHNMLRNMTLRPLFATLGHTMSIKVTIWTIPTIVSLSFTVLVSYHLMFLLWNVVL